jgi:hypothetical protein
MKIVLSVLLFSIFASAELPVNYQSLTALQKQKILWSEIKKTPYKELPETKTGLGIGFMLKSLKSLSSLAVSFDRKSDEMPQGRAKVIHPFGVTAPVEWIAYENEYSGIYQSGGVGFARLSIAGDPALLGFVPGMALKILVKENPSVNLQVMYSLDGQGEATNFFEHSFTNNIPKPNSILLQPLVGLFALVQDPPTYLPVNHFAQIEQNGKNLDTVLAPHSLVFEPTSEVTDLFPQISDVDFRDQLASLEKGTVLYDIYARKNEKSKKVLIGQLKLKDQFVGSEYQDQKLFFQHNR